jgi:hypothetical protein
MNLSTNQLAVLQLRTTLNLALRNMQAAGLWPVALRPVPGGRRLTSPQD